MNYVSLSREQEEGVVGGVVNELVEEGYEFISEGKSASSIHTVTTCSCIYTIRFYHSITPDYRARDGVFIALGEELKFTGRLTVVEEEILGEVGDLTNIKPHEYGLLKLKYGLDKPQLFIPSIFKPYVRQYHKKVREGV